MEIKSVPKTVVEYLRDQILVGQLAPGQKLSENDLASHLDISRPPLREAFRILENECLVVSIPRRGTYVSDVSIEDLRDVYQAREMIERYAIDLLKTKNIIELPQVELAAEATSHLSTPSNDDPEAMLHYGRAFANYHISLVESAGNARLFKFYRGLSSSLTRYKIMYLFIEGSGPRSIREHRQFLDLIKRKAYKEAKKLMREHINISFEFLKTKIPPSSVKRELPARQSLNNSSALERTLNREKEGGYTV
jgi:DNA-binding GntR family transcriptional regulator